MPPPSLAVRVPGSTSNLGPGFDLLGLALELYLDVEVTGPAAGPSSERIEACGEAASWPARGDLLLSALEHGAQRLGAEIPPVALRVRSQVPLERGLGSSGAALVAGLVLARELCAATATDAELLTWAHELEGHPDNITAALLGGCTLSLPGPDGLVAIRQAVHPSIRFAVAWPRRPLPTAAARRALPSLVPFADAVENPRRLACLLEGLRSADARLLELGGEDRLHVRHRLPLVPGAERALAAAREAGAWIATLSGSGSALIALADESRVQGAADALQRELARCDDQVVARVIALETRGARIVRGTLEDLERT